MVKKLREKGWAALLLVLLSCAAQMAVAATGAGRPGRTHGNAAGVQPVHADGRHFGRFNHNFGPQGRWVRDHHGGRFGWWWVAGGAWYLYPAPVYPYPYLYPGALDAPSVALVDPPAPAIQYWYFCEAAQTFYPYVANCPGGWVARQAVPGDVPALPGR